MLAGVLSLGCAQRGKTTVVWISIDGLRHDYIDRASPPLLARLAAEGAISREVVPVFPTLTFPNHVSQTTGVMPGAHGIIANTFFSPAAGERYNMPDDIRLLKSESIWETAKRQGVRSIVADWPVGQRQTGPLAADYAPPSFDRARDDQRRLDDTLATIRADSATEAAGNDPLRLIILYFSAVDSAGHRFGPDAPEVDEALRTVDRQLDSPKHDVINWFEATRAPRDQLFFIVTTDHGMERLHTLVSFDRLLGADLLKDVTVSPGGNVRMLYFNQLDETDRAARMQAVLEKLRQYSFVRAWRKTEQPAGVNMADPDRCGEIVIALAPGYLFTSQRVATTMPVTTSPLGAHGYDVRETKAMLGASIIWRYDRPLRRKDLGRIDNTQWHATVAKLLGISPAAAADARAIRVE